MSWWCVVVVLNALCVDGVFRFSWLSRSTDVDTALQQGANQLVTYETQQFGACWTKAVSALKQGCGGQATEDTRLRLAVGFANCHFAQSGLPTFPCDTTMSIEQCTRPMVSSAIAFNAYTEYTTHVDNICFYVENALFKEQTDDRINRLLEAAKLSVDTITEVKGITANVVSGMTSVLDEQRKAKDSQVQLSTDLQAMRDAASVHHSKVLADLNEVDKVSGKVVEAVGTLQGQQAGLLVHQREFREESAALSRALQEESGEVNRKLQDAVAASAALVVQQATLRSDVDAVAAQQRELAGGIDDMLGRQQEATAQQVKLLERQQQHYQLSADSYDALQEGTADLRRHMEDALKAQEALRESQVAAREALRQMDADSRDALASATKGLEVLMRLTSTIDVTTREQENRLRESYDHIATGLGRLQNLHSTVVGSFFGVESALFYSCVAVGVWLTTTAGPARGARIPLFILLVAALVVEGRYLPAEAATWGGWAWMVRRVLLAAQAIVWLAIAWRRHRRGAPWAADIARLSSQNDRLLSAMKRVAAPVEQPSPPPPPALGYPLGSSKADLQAQCNFLVQLRYFSAPGIYDSSDDPDFVPEEGVGQIPRRRRRIALRSGGGVSLVKGDLQSELEWSDQDGSTDSE